MKDERAVFNAYSKYYDLLYREKDYLAESSYVDQTLRDHQITGARILELGCGTGKHGTILAALGYSVHGIERSREMIAQAKIGNGFSVQEGDICTVRLDQTFDAVISLFHVVSYQTTNSAIHALFSRVSEHLRPGGLFLFDVWYSPAVCEQKPSVRVKRLENDRLEVIRLAEPVIVHNENRVDVNYTVFVRDTDTQAVQILTEAHSMRHFSILEIEGIAKTFGFEQILVEEFLTRAKPSENTWGVCFLLRKLST